MSLFRAHQIESLAILGEGTAGTEDGEEICAEEAETLKSTLGEGQVVVGSCSTILRAPPALQARLDVSECYLEALFVHRHTYPEMPPLFVVGCPSLGAATKLQLMKDLNAFATEQAGEIMLYDVFDDMCERLNALVSEQPLGAVGNPVLEDRRPELTRSVSVRSMRKSQASISTMIDALVSSCVTTQVRHITFP